MEALRSARVAVEGLGEVAWAGLNPAPPTPLNVEIGPHRRFRVVRNTALGIAIMSYDGTLNFGLLGDYDALPDLDGLAAALCDAIAELAAAAGVSTKTRVRA